MRLLFVTLALIALAAAGVEASHLPPFVAWDFYASDAEFAAVIRPYTEAIARNANDAEAHHWLGLAYLHVARLQRMELIKFGGNALGRAISSLERAMQLRPQLATLMPLLEAYMTAGDLEKWRAAVDQAFMLTPPLPLR
jgi:tetratricopeptide (TPR) repeat protein